MTHTTFVSTETARIEVLQDGRGPAIVLLPSSQRDSLHEGDFAQLLASAGFTVLRPQPRGMGRSVGPLEDISLADLAGDVAAVIDALGGGRAVVVGHAFGHSVARVTDMCHPAKVGGIVLLGAAARETSPRLLELLDVAAEAERPLPERLDALRTALFAPGNDPTAWLHGWYPGLRPAYRRAGSSPPKARWWPVSNAPVLDLQGEMDPWRPPATRDELREVLGERVTVQVVAGASHALIPERPDAVADAIVAWIRALPDLSPRAATSD